MDSHGDGAYASNQTVPLPARPSVESVTSPRLQKKRSVKRVRSEGRRLTIEDDGKQRKGSLREVVRRIFGRRSKLPEPEPQSIQSTPLKHKAHRSEPPEVHEQSRAASAPVRRGESADLPRLRSPNAVEFPKSRQLKPLNLPTPFDDPRGTLRRRKTLPSLLVPPDQAQEIAAAIALYEPRTTKSEKRRSRSAGDLRQRALQAGPQRKRSDEIRFWRESIQTTVLRTDDVKTPPPESPVDDRRRSRLNSPYDVQSAFGTDYSRDLEDRVAKLEANLNIFQRSLQRLHTDKRKRAGVIEPQAKRNEDYRTPSMLAEDLREPLAPSQYTYGFEPAPRPSTAPSRPNRPVIPDEPVPPLPEPEPPQEVLLSENATFRSLYRMLSDERSARRRLETQLRNMRTEITDLQYHVSSQSQVQSQRSSYLYPADGSSRIRDLLSEVERQPAISRFSASTRQESEAEAVAGDEQGHTPRQPLEIVTDLEMEEQEVETPYDSYQTPRQEVAMF